MYDDCHFSKSDLSGILMVTKPKFFVRGKYTMFRISRRLDYGLQLMVALAIDTENRAQSTASLAEKLQIPLPFLHQIGHTLMQAGMIKATPGPRGGLRLNKSAENITVLEIVEILEGKVSVNPNTDDGDAPSPVNSAIWTQLQERIINYLSGIRLEELVNQAQDLRMFSIPVGEPVAKLN
jgi:Rrf2 family protein